MLEKTYEVLRLALVLDLDVGLATLADDVEGEVLHVGLDLGVIKLAADETLRVEEGVVGVHGEPTLCGISGETLGVGDGEDVE